MIRNAGGTIEEEYYVRGERKGQLRGYKVLTSGQCEHVERGRRCTKVGTDVDHIHAGNYLGEVKDENGVVIAYTNLQLLCLEHHKRKTNREAIAARLGGSLQRDNGHPGSLI